MCGISGLANWGNRETLARMTAVQRHRGPNDGGLWDHRSADGSYIGLGSRRLSILDLSETGHMPMSNEDGTVWITYNGEIYNARTLRRELEAKGHQFMSFADTEVVIHLYEEEGAGCAKRLNGMFAFAICDLRVHSCSWRAIILASSRSTTCAVMAGWPSRLKRRRSSKFVALKQKLICSRLISI